MYYIQGKSMESADIGCRKEFRLLFKENEVLSVLVAHLSACGFRPFAYIFNSSADCLLDFFLHLGGCSIGECHD